MATQWVKLNPADYDLEAVVSSLERCFSTELEVGLGVQVLRAVTLPGKDKWAVKRALVTDSEVWADATVTRGRDSPQYVYAMLIHEE